MITSNISKPWNRTHLARRAVRETSSRVCNYILQK